MFEILSLEIYDFGKDSSKVSKKHFLEGQYIKFISLSY